MHQTSCVHQATISGMLARMSCFHGLPLFLAAFSCYLSLGFLRNWFDWQAPLRETNPNLDLKHLNLARCLSSWAPQVSYRSLDDWQILSFLLLASRSECHFTCRSSCSWFVFSTLKVYQNYALVTLKTLADLKIYFGIYGGLILSFRGLASQWFSP